MTSLRTRLFQAIVLVVALCVGLTVAGGLVLTIYDRILGTFTPSDRAESVMYGLDEVDPTRIASFRGLVSMPFEHDGQRFLTQKSGSGREYPDNIPT